MPNLEEEHISAEQTVNDYIANIDVRGEYVSDIDWERGHFLMAFPHLFICNNDNGGDITYIEDKVRSDRWIR